ncbi:hypothetical protein LAUMK191_02998 [Mycobacterium attenuatum]|nr:hypothetical protein LAUMK191_02998 [Mycobacterium attenuatum]
MGQLGSWTRCYVTPTPNCDPVCAGYASAKTRPRPGIERFDDGAIARSVGTYLAAAFRFEHFAARTGEYASAEEFDKSWYRRYPVNVVVFIG